MVCAGVAEQHGYRFSFVQYSKYVLLSTSDFIVKNYFQVGGPDHVRQFTGYNCVLDDCSCRTGVEHVGNWLNVSSC